MNNERKEWLDKWREKPENIARYDHRDIYRCFGYRQQEKNYAAFVKSVRK